MAKRLPLTLGIAGRIAKDMGMSDQDDWSDVVELMREEESEGASPIDAMIATSLRALDGALKQLHRQLQSFRRGRGRGPDMHHFVRVRVYLSDHALPVAFQACCGVLRG